MSFVRFLSAEKDLRRIKEGFYSILIFVTITGLCLSTLLFLLSDVLAQSIFQDPDASYFIKAGSGLILLGVTTQITLFYFRIFHQIRTFALLTVFQSVGKLIVILTLLWLGYGLLGVIFASLVVQGMLLLISAGRIVSQIGFIFPCFTQIREYLRYGLPLTPNSLIRWVTDSSDRYIIGIILGVGAVGIYSAAYAIGNLIQLFISPIQFILFPTLSKLYDEGKIDDVKVYLSYSMKYFLFIAIPAVFGLSVLATPLLEIFTSPEFIPGSSVIPLIAVAGLMGGVFQIIINITHLVKKTQFNLFIHIIAALINVILNVILIPMMGILGAAIATTLSYLVMVIICTSVSFRYIRFNLHWDFIVKSIVASGIMAGLVVLMNPAGILDLILSIVGGALVYFFTMVMIFRSFSHWEYDMLKNLVMKQS